MALPCKQFTILSSYQAGVIDGMILSDAGVYSYARSRSQRFVATTIHEEFALHLQSLIPFYTSVTVRNQSFRTANKDVIACRPAYCLTSRSDLCLSDFRSRWYGDDGLKRIPEDLQLTPTLALYWFLGDGFSTYGTRRRSIAIGLCTDCFTKNECDFLISLWERITPEIQFTIKVIKGKYHRLMINRKASAKAFFEFIGNSPVACFEYKWKAPSSIPRRKSILEPLKDEILRLRQMLSYDDIAEAIGSKHGISIDRTTIARRLKLWSDCASEK